MTERQQRLWLLSATGSALRRWLGWALVATALVYWGGTGLPSSLAQGKPAASAEGDSAPEPPQLPAPAVPAPSAGGGASAAGPAPGGPGAAGQLGLMPFGHNLFMGNFLRAREDGLNPDYVIMPGDHVSVHTWGVIDFNEVLVVDGQGNVFLPGIGPVRLAGVRNRELTSVVTAGLGRVYSRNFEVYTNLMTAKPVAVYVTGGVARPGRYAGVPSDSLLFFLDQAGGIEPSLGSYRRIAVLRGEQRIAEIDLYDFILAGKMVPLQFQDGDVVLVERRGPVIELTGDVASPTLLEFRADRFDGADALGVIPGAARATEVTVQGIRDGTPFVRTLALADFSHLSLRDGDRIELRGEGRAGHIVVRIEGEFEGVSELSVRRGSRLLDVLNHVEVKPRLANTRAVHLRRGSVARAQKDSIEDSLFRLERSALLALSQSQGESAIRAKEAELTQSFVERARLIQPLGRVVTARDGQQRNIVLEEGDVIVIPGRTNVVRVGGEVMMAQAVMYRPGMKAKHYIRDAGGPSERADRGKVIVLHANAEVEIGDAGTRVLPGDEVLVPPRIDRKLLQNAADVTQVIYQIAVSAGVVVAIL